MSDISRKKIPITFEMNEIQLFTMIKKYAKEGGTVSFNICPEKI